MIQQAYITAWRASAPWQDDAQVEQDLVLSRAVVAIFEHPELARLVALRGGTALNKLFIQPPAGTRKTSTSFKQPANRLAH